MGLLDDVTGGMMDAVGKSSGGGGLLEQITHLVNDPNTGGLSGLVQSFQQKGLSDVVGSWVSTGKNLPISAEQIQGVLGSEKIQQIAGSLGIPLDQVSAGLSQLLPQVVDKLTPEGSIPSGDLLSKGLDLLKGSLGGR